jgi:MA3 domain
VLNWGSCSARDLEEAALCVKELGASNHHSDMVCAWVSESLEKKDRERDLLVKLLVRLHRNEPPLLSHDHLEKGYDFFLGRLGIALSLCFPWMRIRFVCLMKLICDAWSGCDVAVAVSCLGAGWNVCCQDS